MLLWRYAIEPSIVELLDPNAECQSKCQPCLTLILVMRSGAMAEPQVIQTPEAIFNVQRRIDKITYKFQARRTERYENDLF